MSVDGLREYESVTMYNDEGRTTIPQKTRRKLSLEPGDEIGFIFNDEGVEVVNLTKRRSD